MYVCQSLHSYTESGLRKVEKNDSQENIWFNKNTDFIKKGLQNLACDKFF